MMTYIYKIKQKVNVTMWTKFWTSLTTCLKKSYLARIFNAFIAEKLSRNLIHLHISDDGDKFFLVENIFEILEFFYGPYSPYSFLTS